MRSDVEAHEKTVFSGYYYDGELSERDAIAMELAERIAGDPHSVTDDFYTKLKKHYTDAEIVELVFACSIFNWGNKFNITMRLDTDGQNYDKGMEYVDAPTFWRDRPAQGVAVS